MSTLPHAPSNTLDSPRLLRPDAKGRITLGALAEGVSSYLVSIDASGIIHLEPQVEIPAAEVWLYRNPEALASVRRGIAEAEAGELVDRGEFGVFTHED